MAQTETNARRFSQREKQLLIGSAILITLFAFESLATTTVMPTVLAELGNRNWLPVATGAALSMQVLSSASAGGITDWRGPRATLLAGVTLFGVGLLVAGFAPHITVFVAGRALQGLGAGLATVPLYVLVGSIVTEQNRPTFFAAFSMAWVLPSLIGPPIAGLVTEAVGWRPIFWFVPILVVGVLLALTPLLLSLKTNGSSPDASLLRTAALATTVGVGLLGAQMSSSLRGPSALPLLLGSLTVAIGALVPLLPAGTFRLVRGIPSLVATRGLTISAHIAGASLVPMILQDVHGWSPAGASLAVGAGSLSWAGGSVIQSKVRTRRDRLPHLGAMAIALGLAILILLPTGLLVWPFGLVGTIIAGFGIGLAHATLSDLALAALPTKDHAWISSALQVADTAGPAAAMSLVALAFVLAGITGGSPWVYSLLVSVSIALIAIGSSGRIGPQATRLA